MHESAVRTYIDIRDSHEEDLESILPQAVQAIKNALSDANGKILVHCRAGMSRSASCVIAYLMEVQEMTASDAFKFVQSKRDCITPNESFD